LSHQLGKPQRTIPADAQLLIRLLSRWHPDRELILVGDSAFAVARLGHTCRQLGVRLVARVLLHAHLDDPVPPQPTGKPGVKPKQGPRQPQVKARLGTAAREQTPWLHTEVDWYAGHRLPMDLARAPARWHRDGEEPLPLRWVLLRDPTGARPLRPLVHRRCCPTRRKRRSSSAAS
jgi:hypothetical protein